MNYPAFIKNFDFEVNAGLFNNVEIKNIDSNFILFVDGLKWMNYDAVTKQQALEFYIHYELAHGHVATTGLGLGIREQLLLSKSSVSKLTIIEKSSDLINYHKTHSKWANDSRVDFVNLHADQYLLKSDVLLLDHFEQQNFISILNQVQSIANKCTSKTIWFWPFEVYIRCNAIKHNLTFLDSYNDLLDKFRFNNFPILSQDMVDIAVDLFPNNINTKQIESFV